MLLFPSLPKQHTHDYKSVSFLKLCNIHYSVLSAYFIDNGNNNESLILSLIMCLVIWGFNVCYTCNWIQWQNEKLLASNPNCYYNIIISVFIIQNSESICMEDRSNRLSYKPDSPHSSILSNMNSSWTLRSILGKWHIMNTTTMQSNIAARFISDARCVFFLRVRSWLIWMPRKMFKLKYTSAVKIENEVCQKYVYT